MKRTELGNLVLKLIALMFLSGFYGYFIIYVFVNYGNENGWYMIGFVFINMLFGYGIRDTVTYFEKIVIED